MELPNLYEHCIARDDEAPIMRLPLTPEHPTIIVMVGLPRSGKSTWARKSGYPVISRDALRLALHGTAWFPQAEEMVSGTEMVMAIALTAAGHNIVVLDSCHHTAQRRERWRQAARQHGWDVVFALVDTDSDVCLSRAKSEDQQYLPSIIDRMAGAIDVPLCGSGKVYLYRSEALPRLAN